MSSTPDYRISATDVTGMDDGSFAWAIIEKAWPDVQEPDISVKCKNATKGQKAVLAVTFCQREVDNGGFEQIFHNETGGIIGEVISGFELLGMKNRADLVSRARAFFPASVQIEDQQSRRNYLAGVSASARSAFFDPLDQEFYADSEPKLWPFFRKYVDQHPDEFFR